MYTNESISTPQSQFKAFNKNSLWKLTSYILLTICLQIGDISLASLLDQMPVLVTSSILCVYLIALRKITRLELYILIFIQLSISSLYVSDISVTIGLSVAQGLSLIIFQSFLMPYPLASAEGLNAFKSDIVKINTGHPDPAKQLAEPLEPELLKKVTRICGAWLIAATVSSCIYAVITAASIKHFFVGMSAYWLASVCTFVALAMPIMADATENIQSDRQPPKIKAYLITLITTIAFLGYSLLIINNTPYPFIYILLPMCLAAVRLPVKTIAFIIYGSFAGNIVLGLLPFTEAYFYNAPVSVEMIHTVCITGFIPLFFAFMVKAFEKRQGHITKLSERMSLANKAVGLGVWEWSISTRNVWWDCAMYNLYGLSEQPMTYARWRQCIHPDDVTQLERMLKTVARAKNEFSTSFRIVHPVLGIRHIQAAATIVHSEANRPLRYVGMNWDVTNLKSAELALHLAKQKAEVASHTKSEFVANMSHEIRTPLNATLGAAQLLQNTDLSAPQKKYINMIKHSGESLLAIVNDILDFSKIESGHSHLALSMFNLRDSAQKITNILSPQAGAKGLEFILHIDKNVPTCVEGDALKLHQVLVNLTSNAIRFTHGGEVRVEITAGKPRQGKIKILFAVIDTGIGIAKNNQLNLFDAFTQVDSSSTRQYGGTGLGLAIAKRLVKLMGGELELESDEGCGSRFYFSLELTQIASRNLTHPLESQPLRVLLIEQNSRVIEAVKHLVAHWPWDLIAATSAQRALGIFPTANKLKPIDLVIIDSRVLAEDDPLLVSQLVKLGLSNECLHILSDINHASSSLSDQPSDAIDSYLIKPITHSNLLEAIQEGRNLRQGINKPIQHEMNLLTQMLSGINILLVEDNPLNQVVAKGLLEQFGAHIDQAWNGREALELISKNNRNYHVIMLDIQMPIMDGYSTCHALKERGNKTPIIAMTAGVLSSEREHCERMGMQGFVPKPIEIQTLLNEIKRLLPNLENAASPPAVFESEPIEHTLFYPERLLQHITQKTHADSIVQGIKQLIANSEALQENLAAGIATEDFLAVAKILHNQKGAWGNLGAAPLHRQICSLETLAQERRLTLSCRQWHAYTQLFAQTRREAQDWMSQQPTYHCDDAAPLFEYRAGDIGSLLTQLDEQSFRACDSYAQLKPSLNTKLDAIAAAELESAMHNLEFARALAILRENSLL
jgi:two-component system, sensor histidine kinase and response regulator